MVMLAPLGLTVAIALPNLQTLYDSVTRNTQCDRIPPSWAGRRRLGGRNWVVLGTTGEVASLDGAEVRRLGDIHALDVPEGWAGSTLLGTTSRGCAGGSSLRLSHTAR